MHNGDFGCTNVDEQRETLFTMWKYIAIASLVLLTAGTFVLYKTHQGLVSLPTGEIASLRTEYKKAIEINERTFMDKANAAYALKRGEWLKQRKKEADEQETKLQDEIANNRQEIERLQREYQSIGGSIEEFKDKQRDVLRNLVNCDALQKVSENLHETANVELESLDDSDPEVLTSLARNVTLIEEKEKDIENEKEKEESTIQALGGRKEKAQEAIAQEDALSRERQARVSPQELNCSVVVAEPAWEYVIVDAGIDKGVVIGSRLAVMRGETKICEMNVTLVEANRSSCDIVTKTLLAGEAVELGDRVVAVRPESKG